MTKEDSWIKHYWRPAMAWQYLAVCLFDFILGPVLTGIFAYYTNTTYVPWTPLTLSEGGFYHLSMAAIIGVAAWTRGQEKIKKITEFGAEITEKDNVSQDPIK